MQYKMSVIERFPQIKVLLLSNIRMCTLIFINKLRPILRYIPHLKINNNIINTLMEFIDFLIIYLSDYSFLNKYHQNNEIKSMDLKFKLI